LFAVLFAWAFIGQLPALIQLFGGALIVAGVALVYPGVVADVVGVVLIVAVLAMQWFSLRVGAGAPVR
jgi:UPF0716 family protein affecting phage T7 exclusion